MSLIIQFDFNNKKLDYFLELPLKKIKIPAAKCIWIFYSKFIKLVK